MNTEDARRRRSGVPRPVALTMLVTAVVGTAFGLVGAAFATSTYTAEATVLVSPLAGNPFTPDGNGDDLTNLQTEAQLASSDAVAQLVTGGATTGTGSDILNGLSVKVPSNTQVLVLDYRAGSRDLAKARAQSFAQSYLKFRVSRNEQVVAAQAQRIQDGIDTQTARLSQLAKKKQTVTSPEQRSVLQQQIDAATTQVAQLSTTLSDLQTSKRDPGEVITPSHVVSRSPGLTWVLYGFGGLVAGLLFGLVVVVLRTWSAEPSGSKRIDDPRTNAAMDPSASIRSPSEQPPGRLRASDAPFRSTT